MFLMWRLWRMLKGPLERILAGKFSALAGQLRAVLSSTVNDLARAVQDGFAYSMVGAHITSASVTPPGKPSVTFKVFPLSAIEGASCIRQQLVKRLSVDVRLDALRTKAGVSDADWKQVLETYATEVQRFGVVNAIKQLVKQNKSLGSDYTLIDLAENEPLKINGKSALDTLVVSYWQNTYDDDAPKVKKAAKIWNHRTESGYEYKVAEYDGYKAT